MHLTQTTHVPLSSYPDDIQQKVLELVTPADLCRLKLVSKTEKAVVDKFSSLLMKKDLKKKALSLKKGLKIVTVMPRKITRGFVKSMDW